MSLTVTSIQLLNMRTRPEAYA